MLISLIIFISVPTLPSKPSYLINLILQLGKNFSGFFANNTAPATVNLSSYINPLASNISSSVKVEACPKTHISH